jgi:hypothetical protein
MKAISLVQPDARKVVTVHLHIADLPWNTNYRGPVFIHAARRASRHAEENDNVGGIVGLATLVNVQPSRRTGLYEFWFKSGIAFARMVPLAGRTGLFRLTRTDLGQDDLRKLTAFLSAISAMLPTP